MNHSLQCCGVLGIKPRSALCKASALSAIWSLWPLHNHSLKKDSNISKEFHYKGMHILPSPTESPVCVLQPLELPLTKHTHISSVPLLLPLLIPPIFDLWCHMIPNILFYHSHSGAWLPKPDGLWHGWYGPVWTEAFLELLGFLFFSFLF